MKKVLLHFYIFIRAIILNKMYSNKLQKGNILSFTMTDKSFSPHPPFYNVVYWQGLFFLNIVQWGREWGREEFNFTPKLGKVYIWTNPKTAIFCLLPWQTSLSSPSPILQCCILTRAILPQHYIMREGMRQGEIQFHPRIEFVQNILSKIVVWFFSNLD